MHFIHKQHIVKFCKAGAELTNGGDGGNNFSKFELVQDGRLPSSVQSNHQDPHFFLAKQAFEQRSESPHLVSPVGT